MSDENKARLAYEVLDGLSAGRILSQENEQLLRSFLPELPKQKTLAEIIAHVDDAWSVASGNDWGGNSYDPDVSIEDWLTELHIQLKGLIGTPVAVPALPAGMRLADHERHGRVVAAPVADGDGRHMIFCLDNTSTAEAGRRWVRASSLTFIDTERAKYAHPKFLEAEADYQKAPEGTIVALDGSGTIWLKKFGGWRNTAGDHGVESACIALDSRRVLRWGWGK